MARVTDLACAHSDLVNAKQVLRMAEIIDEEGHWIAGNDTLVQTGDMVDRGQYWRVETWQSPNLQTINPIDQVRIPLRSTACSKSCEVKLVQLGESSTLSWEVCISVMA